MVGGRGFPCPGRSVSHHSPEIANALLRLLRDTITDQRTEEGNNLLRGHTADALKLLRHLAHGLALTTGKEFSIESFGQVGVSNLLRRGLLLTGIALHLRGAQRGQLLIHISGQVAVSQNVVQSGHISHLFHKSLPLSFSRFRLSGCQRVVPCPLDIISISHSPLFVNPFLEVFQTFFG